MSAGQDLWQAIYDALTGSAALVALVDGIYDKAPDDPWGENEVYITRGPFYGSPEDADCIIGQEITGQIDVWSRRPDRWSVDDVIGQVKFSLHNQDLAMGETALATIEVRLWRVTDDPDPTQQHGIVQVVAVVEEAEEA